jgi:2-methylcitrate dehydratase PrpD
MSAVAERLAAFALAPVAAAEGARAMMRLSLLDWAAVAFAGVNEPVARILRERALVEGGQGEASVIGTPVRMPARAAALVNGATSHALDYDDTHFAHIGHPSVAVIPAALALAEVTGADGAAFLDAALVGVEASVRVGVWLGRGHYQTGFHQTATAGAFGATLAAARLLGLEAGQAGHALGIASTRAAGLKSQFGTMGKPYHAGLAAQTGIEAARLAKDGFISNPDGLEGAQGFGPTHAGAGDVSAFDGIGRDWLFETVSHKFHACCHGTHASLEALAGLRGQIGPAPVEAVTLVTHPRWMSVCNIAEPQTGLEVKFSYRHVTAMALAGHDTSALASFSDAVARDAALRKTARRVRVETDETLPETASRVRVALAGGKVLEAFHDLDAPVPIALRQEKLMAKAAGLLGPEQAERLWARIRAGEVPARLFG